MNAIGVRGKMKVGVIPVNIGVQSADRAVQTAQFVESLGYESVWTFACSSGHHVRSKYPYNKSGNMGAAQKLTLSTLLIALAAVAASTTTLRLATGNILSQVNPIYGARRRVWTLCSTVSLCWVGIGWLREEFEALGVPFEHRGARFDDYVAGRAKFGPVRVEHESDFVFLKGFMSYPLPIQNPFPVVMGGVKGKICLNAPHS